MTCTSVNAWALSGSRQGVCKLTSAIKYLSQTDETGFHYSITDFCSQLICESMTDVIIRGMCSQ